MSQQFPPSAPPPPMQPPYPQQPAQQIIVQQGANASNLSPTVTMGDWFLFFILQCIPGVNLIMLIVFACDSNKPSRANYCKLMLLLMIIVPILAFLIITLFFGGLATVMNNMQ